MDVQWQSLMKKWTHWREKNRRSIVYLHWMYSTLSNVCLAEEKRTTRRSFGRPDRITKGRRKKKEKKLFHQFNLFCSVYRKRLMGKLSRFDSGRSSWEFGSTSLFSIFFPDLKWVSVISWNMESTLKLCSQSCIYSNFLSWIFKAKFSKKPSRILNSDTFKSL